MNTTVQDNDAQNCIAAVAQIIDTCVASGDFPQMQTSSLAMASQMYMWEPANPTERADFEEDLIASTNERNYQQPLTCKQVQSYQGRLIDSREGRILVSSLFEAELERRQAFDEITGGGGDM